MPGPRLNAAFYADRVASFLRASDDEVYAPLANLNVATRHGSRDDAAHAVFLAGNGRGGGLTSSQAASTS